MPSIRLTGIRKSFGDVEVLKQVSLHVQDGEFITLVGPSGCGKSTLLRILAGLEAADEGTVEIGGSDVTAARPSDRNLAMVFQSYALYPHLTVRQNMLTPLRLRDLSRFEDLPFLGRLLARRKHRALEEKVQMTAAALQIRPLLDRKPGQLSGGQRQRAALGRAMVRDPYAFLMDEPLSNLDAALRVHMRAELSELHRRLGTTFVYVTHDQAEALTMSDRMAVMQGGHILQIGAPNAIYDDPDTLDVAQFVGSPSINLLPGEIDMTGTVRVLDKVLGQVSHAAHQPVTVGVRPENLRITPGRGQGLAGIVRHRENLGSDIFLHVEAEGLGPRLVVRVAPPMRADTDLGARVSLCIDPAAFLLFQSDGQRLRLPRVRQAEIA